QPPQDVHPPNPPKPPPQDVHPPNPPKPPPQDVHPPNPPKPPPQDVRPTPAHPLPPVPPLVPNLLVPQPVLPPQDVHPPQPPKPVLPLVPNPLVPQPPVKPQSVPVPHQPICDKATFLLAARGSGEPDESEYPGSHNLGGIPKRPGVHEQPSALILLHQKLDQPVGTTGIYGVPYEAIWSPSFYRQSAFWSNHPKVPESTKTGAELLADEIRKHAACPGQKILLAGYSQGAVLVREAVNMLPREIQDRISGIALFGDPLTMPGTRIGAALPKRLSAKSWCAKGDPICDTKVSVYHRYTRLLALCSNKPLSGLCEHFNYPKNDVDHAVDFLNRVPTH
ncbi:cutinase family protein, partial [Streptomyces virginiae]|uniref:cutinase family protein n=2 Tax=Streptomyces virginiae TaxID=1961 RepID=UPI0037CE830F